MYSGLTEEDYDNLSAIAPTVAQPGDHVDYGVPWEELTRTVGVAVGRPEAADALVATVEAEIAAAVEATGEEFGGNLSPERAEMLDVDAIVWLDAAEAGELGGPLYETFAVHTEGREVFLDSFGDPLGGATSFVSALSLPFLLEGLVPMLAAAVDGDPSTAVTLD